MDHSKKLRKFLRMLQFRKHIKELTSTCKRINKDGCYDFVTTKQDILSKSKKSIQSDNKEKTNTNLSNKIESNLKSLTVNDHEQSIENMNFSDHLFRATPTSPANILMIVSQSYKPLHAKSTIFNKNTIAVTKGTYVKAFYTISNWVFIEKRETCETGFIPIYCLRLPQSKTYSKALFETSSLNNLSLLNVSIYEKPNYQRASILNSQSFRNSTSSTGGHFISAIGPCRENNDTQISTCPRRTKSGTYTRRYLHDQSTLSRQISFVSIHGNDADAYGTLNLTPGRSLSFHTLDKQQSNVLNSNDRLRVIENYQRQFVGDISVLESEVVTLVNPSESIGDWRLVKRGDGKQGYVPKHIVVLDRCFT